MRRKVFAATGLLAALLVFTTLASIQNPMPALREVQRGSSPQPQLTDRFGTPLTLHYGGRFNTQAVLRLDAVPPLLLEGFIASEDRRFFAHNGVDWRARGSALWARLGGGQTGRGGASTLTEQVIRQLHPRPRTLWSKWLEGFEAIWLEQQSNKATILEFYLNQVPYAANRRGVMEAARYYFDRDVTTLNTKETLALVLLVRAPSAFDLYKDPAQLDAPIERLAETLYKRGVLDAAARQSLKDYALALTPPRQPLDARAFVAYVRAHTPPQAANGAGALRTTLNGNIQQAATRLLETRLQTLRFKNAQQAALLVVNNQTREVLAYVSIGADCAATKGTAPACQIDMVTSPRQPGSALKPFLYAAALDKGWTAATLIEDAPYAESIRGGLHAFHNYSRQYYGAVTLREALGNSLNIPALHAIDFVSPPAYLKRLHRLGFDSLAESADFYDAGLALGVGEVTLLQLVRAYTALAGGGVFMPLRLIPDEAAAFDASEPPKRVYSVDAASLIGNILSDPYARTLEFGRNSVLNLPIQTAVKTGTSTDYKDAWVVGYDYRYTVGIWLGNADRTPMDGVTGSTGAALVLRSIFSLLNAGGTEDAARPLYLSPTLEPKDICVKSLSAEAAACLPRTEYFSASAAPHRDESAAPAAVNSADFALLRPASRLSIAFDPRIPTDKQAFAFAVRGLQPGDTVRWRVNDAVFAETQTAQVLWPIQRGHYRVAAELWRGGVRVGVSETAEVVVK